MAIPQPHCRLDWDQTKELIVTMRSSAISGKDICDCVALLSDISLGVRDIIALEVCSKGAGLGYVTTKISGGICSMLQRGGC
jgi:hypothetical protein